MTLLTTANSTPPVPSTEDESVIVYWHMMAAAQITEWQVAGA